MKELWLEKDGVPDNEKMKGMVLGESSWDGTETTVFMVMLAQELWS